MGSLVRTACVVEVIRLPMEASDREWIDAVENMTMEAIEAARRQVPGRNNYSAYSVTTAMLPEDGNPQKRCMVTVVVGFEPVGLS